MIPSQQWGGNAQFLDAKELLCSTAMYATNIATFQTIQRRSEMTGGRRTMPAKKENLHRRMIQTASHVETLGAQTQYPPSTSDASHAEGDSAASTLDQTSSVTIARSDQRKTLFLWVDDLGESPARLISLTISLPLLLCPY